MHYGNENLVGKCQICLNINFIYAKYEKNIIKIAFVLLLEDKFVRICIHTNKMLNICMLNGNVNFVRNCQANNVNLKQTFSLCKRKLSNSLLILGYNMK